MTVTEFLSWDAPSGAGWQLVDGEPRAMAPTSRTYGAIHGELSCLIGNHLSERSGSCSVIVTPGIVPWVQSNTNFRIPDLAVTCSVYETEEHAVSDPVILIEVLSPSNRAETWTNVWAYASIPSVQEIVAVESAKIAAVVIRRKDDSSWPSQPKAVEDDLIIESIGFRTPLVAFYLTSRLAAKG